MTVSLSLAVLVAAAAAGGSGCLKASAFDDHGEARAGSVRIVQDGAAWTVRFEGRCRAAEEALSFAAAEATGACLKAGDRLRVVVADYRRPTCAVAAIEPAG